MFAGLRGADEGGERSKGNSMRKDKPRLSLLPDTFAIFRLDPNADIPTWALSGEFVSITRTTEELSVVCRQENVPDGIRCETDYVCLKVEGPFDFNSTGILGSLTTVLAQAAISVFAVSTFHTDYLLVKENKMEGAIQALSKAGHHVASQLTAGS